MAMTTDRAHTCCFTGHRPEKLSLPEETVRQLLEAEILLSIQKGYTDFITGMADGTDTWAAQIVLSLRETFPQLRLHAAVPYAGFVPRKAWKNAYEDILARADSVTYVSPSREKNVFQIRNIWMVDRSSRVIAVYNGTSGGTRNTVLYAFQVGVRVRNVLMNARQNEN